MSKPFVAYLNVPLFTVSTHLKYAVDCRLTLVNCVQEKTNLVNEIKKGRN